MSRKRVFNKILSFFNGNKSMSEDDQVDIIASVLMMSLDKQFRSVPNISTRLDLLIRYMSRTILRSIKIKEPYNVLHPKKRNDGVDFVLLETLMLPARVCTSDKMNNIKLIKSYQSSWILSPEELVNEFHKTDTLAKLCFK